MLRHLGLIILVHFLLLLHFCQVIHFYAASQDWPLHQPNIKNVFIHSDLHKEIYMEQPIGFVA